MKVSNYVTFSFLFSLMGPCSVFLCDPVQVEQAVGHMSRSAPGALRWSARVCGSVYQAGQLLWEVWALLKVHVRLWLQATKSEAVLERRDSSGPGGAVDLLLWVQREVPNSCGSQGRFRGLLRYWGGTGGGRGSHGSSVWPQKPSSRVLLIPIFLRKIDSLSQEKNILKPFSCFLWTLTYDAMYFISPK